MALIRYFFLRLGHLQLPLYSYFVYRGFQVSMLSYLAYFCGDAVFIRG